MYSQRTSARMNLVWMMIREKETGQSHLMFILFHTGIVCKEESKNKKLNITINFDEVTWENRDKHKPDWPQYPDHRFRILIDKIVLCIKYPYESRYKYLIKKRKTIGLKHFKDPKAFIEYSNDMKKVYNCIEEYNIGINKDIDSKDLIENIQKVYYGAKFIFSHSHYYSLR